MRTMFAVLCALLVSTPGALSQESNACAVPGYLLFGDSPLHRVSAAVQKNKAVKIVVVGTGSSMLPGPDGSNMAYPARLEAALKARLPTVNATVVAKVKPRQSAAEISASLEKLVTEEKPTLVIWQTGTFDALRGVDPESFRASVSDGVDILQAAGADVILVNMQYSPRTESVIALGPYVDSIRWVAREHEVPVFDRLAVMRHWYDTGAIDLYVATKDVALAKRVHDCIGRALASLIIDAADLETLEGKASK